MTKAELLNKLKDFPFDPSEYWLNAGSALLLYGLRDETNDIDMGCSSKMMDQLIKDHPFTIKGGVRRVVFDDYEIYENWCGEDINVIHGYQLASLETILEFKKRLNRPKDQKDINNIQVVLGK